MPLAYVELYDPYQKNKQGKTEDAFANRLTKFIMAEKAKQGISQKELAERSNTPQSTITRVLTGKVSSKIDTLLPILESLSYTLAIVPTVNKDAYNVLSDTDTKSLYGEYSNAISTLDGVTELNANVRLKVLFNVVSKQHNLCPLKVRRSTKWRDNIEGYTIYQEILLEDYNRPLSVSLEVAKFNNIEDDSKKVVAYISNDILGIMTNTNQKFWYYFSQVKFYLDNEESVFSDDEYGFLYDLDDDPEFASFLEKLIELVSFEESEIEIILKVINKGYGMLEPWEKIVFIENIMDFYYLSHCAICNSPFSWDDMLTALADGNHICGRCKNGIAKAKKE